MTDRAQAVLREALTLGVDERADVAAELLASLDDEPAEDLAEVEMAWAKEIERRARRVLAGESAGEPWEEVRARVERRLKQR
jgi:putative addiction module component (TIGR02574 family)